MVYPFKTQIKGITKPPVSRGRLIPTQSVVKWLYNVTQAAFRLERAPLFAFEGKSRSGIFPKHSLQNDF